jgi:hypothetical protein
VLGAMLLDDRANRIAAEMLREDDFYSLPHRLLFRIFLELGAEHPLDEVVIKSELKLRNLTERVGGEEVLGLLIEKCPSASGVERYAMIVRERASDREWLCHARRIQQAVWERMNLHDDEEAPPVYALKAPDLPPSAAQSTGKVAAIRAEIAEEVAGRRYAVKWPGQRNLTITKALLPDSITVLVGSQGASKSLFLAEQFWRWHAQGVPVALLELERGANFHLRRAAAQMAGCSRLTDSDWTNEYPEEAAAAMDRVNDQLMELSEARVIQGVNARPDAETLLRWITLEAKAGKRVLGIDAVGLMEAKTDKRFNEEDAFVDRAGKLAERYGISLIWVHHPIKHWEEPDLGAVGGSAAYTKWTDTVVWLTSHDDETHPIELPEKVAGMYPRESLVHNRTLWFLKTRLGAGAGLRIAYRFSHDTLCHEELGRIVG